MQIFNKLINYYQNVFVLLRSQWFKCKKNWDKIMLPRCQSLCDGGGGKKGGHFSFSGLSALLGPVWLFVQEVVKIHSGSIEWALILGVAGDPRALAREITLVLHPAPLLDPCIQVRPGELLESFPDVVPALLVTHALYGGLSTGEESSGCACTFLLENCLFFTLWGCMQ